MGSTTAIGGAMALAIYGSIIRDKATSDLAPSVAAAVSEAGLPTSALESFLRTVQDPLELYWIADTRQRRFSATTARLSKQSMASVPQSLLLPKMPARKSIAKLSSWCTWSLLRLVVSDIQAGRVTMIQGSHMFL